MDLSRQTERAAELLTKSPADQWEVMALSSQSLEIAVRGSKVDKFQKSASGGLALRTVVDGRLGFSFTLGGGQEALDLAVEQALASARASDLVQEAGLAQACQMSTELELLDPAMAQEPEERKIERAFLVAQAAKKADARVVHVHPAGVDETISQVRLITSQGLDAAYEASVASLGAVAVAAEDGAQEMGWHQQTKRRLADLQPEEVGRIAGRRAVAFLGAGTVAGGRWDVILEPEVAGEFLDLLSHSLKGDAMAKGRSLLAGKEGQAVASGEINIIDDGLLPRGLGSAPVDDEGTCQQRTELIKDGVLQGFVYDRLWGWRQGQASTGNAVRAGIKAPPSVGFTNLHLKPGTRTPEAIRSGMKRGLVITDVMGAHTANPVSGEFSLGASGHLIEDGQIVRPVKSIAMSGQVLELFAAVQEVACDLRFFSRIGSPSLLVGGVSISGG